MVTHIPEFSSHKHRFRIVSTMQRVGEERAIRFQCRLCYENYETYPDRIWRPRKFVTLSEANLAYWARLTDYAEADLRQFYRDAVSRGSTRVVLNMVRQLDGSWFCEPLMRGE